MKKTQATSSIPQQRNMYSNPIEMEISESENVRIEINDMIEEWMSNLEGKEFTNRYESQRHIEKVPPLLLKGENGHSNREYYEPAVVSLGIYHHNRSELAQAEKYKLVTLKQFCLSCGTTIDHLYNRVFEVVEDAKNCYTDGSTSHYSDKEFTKIMLRDACFILFYIECTLPGNRSSILSFEYLGAIGAKNIVRDIFLLENQIPFVVLEVLLELRYPTDKGEDALNRFFTSVIYYGEVMTRDEKVLENKKPLHLLELCRSCFIPLKGSPDFFSTSSRTWWMWPWIKHSESDYNFVKKFQSIASVMELKANGIFLKRLFDESSNEDIRFHSHIFYGELELVRRILHPTMKAIYLNMIAYEMCPHNPNDFRVSTYIRVMKSLVIQRDDVEELRNHNILLHTLGRDEDVVKMFNEIEAPGVNFFMYNVLRSGIDKHCERSMLRRLGYMCKSWWAELITVYFSSPWKTVAFLVGLSILVFTFLQTYFTIRPLPDLRPS